MKFTLQLSEEERELLVEMLDGERRELPAVLHHTRNLEARDGIQLREHVIDGLLQRLRIVTPGSV